MAAIAKLRIGRVFQRRRFFIFNSAYFSKLSFAKISTISVIGKKQQSINMTNKKNI
jgi:hypothetical protein